MLQDGEKETRIEAITIGQELHDRRSGHRLTLNLFLVAGHIAAQFGHKGACVKALSHGAIDQFAVGNDLEIRPDNLPDLDSRHLERLADLDEIGVGQPVEVHQFLDRGAVALGQDAKRFARGHGVTAQSAARGDVDFVMRCVSGGLPIIGRHGCT